MQAIRQRLSPSSARPDEIAVENSAVFSFGPLGTWHMAVAGTWRDNGGGMCAESTFRSFSVRPVSFLGLDVSVLPEVTVAVPEPMQAQGTWCTSYLDGDVRVARSSGGTIFLFRRTNAAAPWAAMPQARLGATPLKDRSPPAGTPLVPGILAWGGGEPGLLAMGGRPGIGAVSASHWGKQQAGR
mmetsp:Transcript_8855/g.26890  ORF Transcript_8855/g.26890 Transcript_8855/m.26890 type:complete len:184 (-) Transcript_8855:314-865(-)